MTSSEGSVESAHESTASIRGRPNDNDINRIAMQLRAATANELGDQQVEGLARSIVLRANSGLERIEGGSATNLSLEEASAMEAVVHVRGRPAVRVLGQKLEDIRAYPESGLWLMLYDQHRKNVIATTKATAAVRVRDRLLPDREWVQGTAVLIRPDLAITNRHVLASSSGSTVLVRRTPGAHAAKLKRSYDVYLDFTFDNGQERSLSYAITDVPFIAVPDDPIDAALLTVKPLSQKKAEVVEITKDEPDIDRLYVVGHPGRVSMLPEDINLVFGNPDERKRVSFGMAMDAETENPIHVVHDASTIGGYSGGAVHGFLDTSVQALHFWGDSVAGNRAIYASALRAHNVMGKLI